MVSILVGIYTNFVLLTVMVVSFIDADASSEFVCGVALSIFISGFVIDYEICKCMSSLSQILFFVSLTDDSNSITDVNGVVRPFAVSFWVTFAVVVANLISEDVLTGQES